MTPGCGWPFAFCTLTATKPFTPASFPFLSGASAALERTGFVVPMFGHETVTTTERVGYTTRAPPSHGVAPEPVTFQATVRVTVYFWPSTRSGSPAVCAGSGWGLTCVPASAMTCGCEVSRVNCSRTRSNSRAARFAAATRLRLITPCDCGSG